MVDIRSRSLGTFGDLLRHLRQRARLTQDELGIAVGYSRAHVARLEGNQRMPDVPAVRARFPEALHLQGDSEVVQRLIQLAVAARDKSGSDIASSEAPDELTQGERAKFPKPILNNLPAPLTSFIGRARELRKLSTLLPVTRLITLTGAGGTGKTRLGLALATAAVDAYADGVWLAELAPLSDPAALPPLLLTILGLHEEASRPALTTLVNALRDKRLLLVLDNCEHLIDACAHLAEAVLQHAPEVQILATSREALGIGGELAWRVPSLQTPDLKVIHSLDELADYEAVRLFVDRAALAMPGFALTATHAVAVQQICSQLDGIPLAIELAAARVKVLSPEEIATRLSDRFRLLTGGSRTALLRHQTLRALIDWSHQLLTAPEKTVLRRLSVFAGGWTMEAAEAVCQGDKIATQEVLEVLSRLVDKSLVVVAQYDGVTRYQMLETIRQYAAEKLEEAGEGVAVRDNHLDYFMSLGERVEPQLGTMATVDQVLIFKRLERDLDNVRHVLDWAMETGQTEKGLRLILVVSNLFIIRAGQKEILVRVEGFVEHFAAPRNTRIEVQAYLLMVGLHHRQGEFDLARVLLERAETSALAFDDLNLHLEILGGREGNAESQGDYVLARSFFNKWREFILSNNLLGYSEELYTAVEACNDGMLSLGEGNYDHAADRLSFCHKQLIQKGSQITSTAMSRSLGYALINIGRFEEAADRFQESLLGNFALGDTVAVAACLAA